MQLLKLKGETQTNWEKLLTELVGISYAGDIRMMLGVEQKDKINGIVTGQYDRLKDIYAPIADKYGITKCASSFKLPDEDIKSIVESRCGLTVPINSYTDLANHISKTNRKTSIKMAVSQFIAGHPIKNVN